MINTRHDISIIPFSDGLAPHFTALNKAWLEKYFAVEPIDELMLSNPRHYFIDKGGFIFFATIDGEVAGTFALVKNSAVEYELSKMAVAENFQGMNAGNRMLEYCIEKATEMNAEKLILYSNTKLKPAIHLYRKYGFVEVPITTSGYVRSNIKMERVIEK